MARIGLRALGVNIDAIKHLTIGDVFGSGVISVPEFNKRFWKFVNDKNLKVKLQVSSKK